MPEWKDTVNLPRTEFPMKADLPTSEPRTLARWAAMDLYGKIRERRKGAPKVDRELGPKKRDMSVADFCRACRAYAERYIGTMTEQFQRLGILATWDAPYLTMNFKYQAAIARAFGKFVEQDLVYKGKKPVHWCIHCRTALAEAEVEYENHTSP